MPNQCCRGTQGHAQLYALYESKLQHRVVNSGIHTHEVCNGDYPYQEQLLMVNIHTFEGF